MHGSYVPLVVLPLVAFTRKDGTLYEVQLYTGGAHRRPAPYAVGVANAPLVQSEGTRPHARHCSSRADLHWLTVVETRPSPTCLTKACVPP